MSVETQSLANLIIDALGTRRGGLFGLFKKRPNQQTKQTIFAASQAYVDRFRERHGKLKILGMSKPVSLDSDYVPVRFLEEDEIKKQCVIQTQKN